MDWMVQEALEGRITAGKSHKGDVAEQVSLTLQGKTVYQLQQFLEDEIKHGGDFFRVRWLVLLHEEIRMGVAEEKAREQGMP